MARGTLPSVIMVLTAAIREAQACAPALVVLDDLDLLLPSTKEGARPDMEGPGAAEGVAQLAQWLEEAVKEVRLSGGCRQLLVMFAAFTNLWISPQHWIACTSVFFVLLVPNFETCFEI